MQLEQAPAKVLRDSVSAFGSTFPGPSLGPRWRWWSGGFGWGAAGPCWGIGGLRPIAEGAEFVSLGGLEFWILRLSETVCDSLRKFETD